MDDVNRLVIVFPNWWGDLPMACYTFLDEVVTDGLEVYPICTHDDNGLAMIERMLAKAYPKAIVKRGLAVRGELVRSGDEKVVETIKKYVITSELTK